LPRNIKPVKTTTTTLRKRKDVFGDFDVGNHNDFDSGDDDDVDDRGWVGNVVMGHLPGAHVAMLALVDWISNRRARRDKR
jgi:hypothetical protein